MNKRMHSLAAGLMASLLLTACTPEPQDEGDEEDEERLRLAQQLHRQIVQIRLGPGGQRLDPPQEDPEDRSTSIRTAARPTSRTVRSK